MRRSFVLFVIAAALSGDAAAYFFRPHNRMAANARELIRRIGSDARLSTFLRDFAQDFDTRSGNSGSSDVEGPKTDEDSTEGTLTNKKFSAGGYSLSICGFYESGCGILCTKDHFHPPLSLPLGQEDAVVHAKKYFDWAVKLFKASVCRPELEKVYRQWAAQALGHAAHLVGDMGAPQHTWPENHLPLLGHGWSFQETWTLKLWDTKVVYTIPTGGGTFLGRYETAAGQAKDPTPGKLPEIMEGLAHESKLWPFWPQNPWLPYGGHGRTLRDAKEAVKSLTWLHTGTESRVHRHRRRTSLPR
jgi:hypothetical protein